MAHEPLGDANDDDRPEDCTLGPSEPTDDNHGEHEKEEIDAEHLE